MAYSHLEWVSFASPTYFNKRKKRIFYLWAYSCFLDGLFRFRDHGRSSPLVGPQILQGQTSFPIVGGSWTNDGTAGLPSYTINLIVLEMFTSCNDQRLINFDRTIFIVGAGCIGCIINIPRRTPIHLMPVAVSSFLTSDGCSVKCILPSHDVARQS